MSAIGSMLRGLFSLLSFGVMIALILKMFFVEVVKVPHNGMAPTLLAGEYVAVWRNADVDMTDIVICQHPARREASVLGRAVAFAGQTVHGDRRGNLVIEGQTANTQYERQASFYDVVREKLFMMRVGEIEYPSRKRHAVMVQKNDEFSMHAYQISRGVFLLGDNRSDTIDDSRSFGEVDPTTCMGQVFMRLFPAPTAAGEIQHSYFDVAL